MLEITLLTLIQSRPSTSPLVSKGIYHTYLIKHDRAKRRSDFIKYIYQKNEAHGNNVGSDVPGSLLPAHAERPTTTLQGSVVVAIIILSYMRLKQHYRDLQAVLDALKRCLGTWFFVELALVTQQVFTIRIQLG